MQYDEGKIVNKQQMVLFFSTKQKEIMKMIHTLKANPGNWKPWVEKNGLWFTAQEILMVRHGFGKYRNLCLKCGKDSSNCGADRMVGPTGKNVCHCESFQG